MISVLVQLNIQSSSCATVNLPQVGQQEAKFSKKQQVAIQHRQNFNGKANLNGKSHLLFQSVEFLKV